jgi:hypothetical protein
VDRVCFTLIAVAAFYFLAEGTETSSTALGITSTERRERFESFFSSGRLVAHNHRW